MRCEKREREIDVRREREREREGERENIYGIKGRNVREPENEFIWCFLQKGQSCKNRGSSSYYYGMKICHYWQQPDDIFGNMNSQAK